MGYQKMIMDIASNIKAIRKAKGITPTMMAKELGIEATNYPRLENRGNQLTYSNLEKISKALGLTVVELITWEGELKKPVIDNALHHRVKELETQLSVYEENRDYRAQEEEYTNAIFFYLLDNVLWDIAYNYNIMTHEEAEKYGIIVAKDVRLWLSEFYWESEDGTHPYAVDLLPENQMNRVLDIFFRLVWVREIIGRTKSLDWFSAKLEEWEDTAGYTHREYYTYKGDVPDLPK